MKITLHGDNQGVQQTCSNIRMTNLKHHRQPNTDLKIEYKKACEGLCITNEWTRSHQDGDKPWETIEDLQNLNLSNMAIMNTWCDRKANEARAAHITHEDADVYPNERWALYTTAPTLKKITGKLDDAIMGQQFHEGLVQYIHRKYKIHPEMLHQVDLESLQHYLKSQRMHKRATTVKTIHKWIPTQDFLHKQHRSESNICQ